MASSSSSKSATGGTAYASTARRLIVRVFLFHIAAALSLVAFLAVAFTVTPYFLSIVEKSERRIDSLKKAALDGLSLADVPSIDTTFTLPPMGESVTEEQLAFMKYYGFIKFDGALAVDEVESMRAEKFRIEKELIDQGRTEINGVPLFRGTGAMNRSIHRIPFSSTRSEIIRNIIHDERFRPVRALIASFKGAGFTPSSVRIGDSEKDGVVYNSYMNLGASGEKKSTWARNQLGWHTDGLRDIAYLRAPKEGSMRWGPIGSRAKGHAQLWHPPRYGEPVRGRRGLVPSSRNAQPAYGGLLLSQALLFQQRA